MKLRIERRGGLIGRLAVGELELSQLGSAARAALDRIIHGHVDATPSPGADRFMYTLQLKNDDGSTQLELKVPEDKMPEELASIPKIEL